MADNKRRGGCLAVIAILIVLAGAAVLYLLLKRDPTVKMTILFESLDGLEEGDRVYLARQSGIPLSGQEIGSVKEVSFNARNDRYEVIVGLEPEFADVVKAPPNSTARIRHYGMMDWSRAVEIINRAGEGEVATAGARIDGVASDTEEQVFVTRAKPADILAEARSGLSSLAEQAQQKLREAEAVLTGPEAQRLKADIEAVRADLEVAGRQAARDAGVAAERALEKGKRLAADLENYGRTDLARSMDQALVDLRAKVAELAATDDRATSPPVTGTIVAPTKAADERTSPAASRRANGPLP